MKKSTTKNIEETSNKEELTSNQSKDSLEVKIASWKKEYGRIFKNTVDGNIIIWKTLSRKDYRELMNIQPTDAETDDLLYFREENIVKKSVLYPSQNIVEKYINEMAGFATVISENILDKSGFKVSPVSEL